MPSVAEMISPDTAGRLVAVRAEAEQRQRRQPEPPVAVGPARPACCPECGQRLPPAPVMFRSGTEDGTHG